MTIYNYLEFLVFSLLLIELANPHSREKRLVIFYIEAFLLTFVLAFRNYNVGGDTPRYVDFFLGRGGFYGDIDGNYVSIEWGFVILARILRFISNHWEWFIFSTSVITLLPFLYYVKKYSSVVSIAFLNFLVCWDLLWLVQTPLRQDMAISLFFVAGCLFIHAQRKNQFFLYALSVLFFIWSLLTHTSMYLVLPMSIFLFFFKLKRKYAYLLIIGTFFLSYFIRSFASGIFDMFNQITRAYDLFSHMNQYYDSTEQLYEMNDDFTISAIAPINIFSLLLLKLGAPKESALFNYKCLVIATCLFNLGITFPLISRIVLLFSLIGTTYVPLNFYKNAYKDYNLVFFALLIILIILELNRHLNALANFKSELEWDILPYSFWF